jgi:hypothetical protein
VEYGLRIWLVFLRDPATSQRRPGDARTGVLDLLTWQDRAQVAGWELRAIISPKKYVHPAPKGDLAPFSKKADAQLVDTFSRNHPTNPIGTGRGAQEGLNEQEPPRLAELAVVGPRRLTRT